MSAQKSVEEDRFKGWFCVSTLKLNLYYESLALQINAAMKLEMEEWSADHRARTNAAMLTEREF